MTTQNQQSFIMYASFYDAAMGLNDEDFREYILALKDYALLGIEHNSNNPMVDGFITMAQPLLEAAAKRREKQVKNGDFGILGGRPRKGETAAEYKARKDALRQSLNLAKTQDNPMGFQSKTLNVNEDENADEKENENWNEKEYVDVKGNADWNEKENVNENADRSEELGINKNTNIIIKTNSISNNSKSCSPQSGYLEISSTEDTDSNDIIDESLGNCLGTARDLKRHSGVILSADRKNQLMQAAFKYVQSHKATILQEGEEYSEAACAILDENIPIVRRACECIHRRVRDKMVAASNKLHDLIMSQSPQDEDTYYQILLDLWKYYVHDKAYWDSKANTQQDELNPYR